MVKLIIRLDFDSGDSIGPGKIRLLEATSQSGSIRKAAERVGMSFRQAWLLLQAIEDMFGAPVIQTVRGGPGGGGTRLTELGEGVVATYRQLERGASIATQAEMAALAAKIHRGTPVPERKGIPRRSRLSRKSLKKK